MTEQRYKAVQAVIGAGRTVGEVASEWGVCRQTMHGWLARHVMSGVDAGHSSMAATPPDATVS